MTQTVVPLSTIARVLRDQVQQRWDSLSTEEISSAEVNLMLQGSPIQTTVVMAGALANETDGFAGMQAVMRIAFMDAQGTARDEMSQWAITELTHAWNGIGEWQA